MTPHELEGAYRRYFPVIRAKATRMLRDSEEAQDVAQETFSRLMAKHDTLRDPEACLAWIYRTASHIAIDRIRRRKARPCDALFEEPAHPVDEEAAHSSKDALAQLLASLPERELQVLMLSRVDGMRQQEVASVLQISDRTVRRILDAADERIAAFRHDAQRGQA